VAYVRAPRWQLAAGGVEIGVQLLAKALIDGATIHCSLITNHHFYGRGAGVGRSRGTGDGLTAGVAVGVGVAVAVGVGVGEPDCAQYLPPVLR
jgi:hypothetical protein